MIAAWMAIHTARSGEGFPFTGQSDPQYPDTIPERECGLAFARSHAHSRWDPGTIVDTKNATELIQIIRSGRIALFNA